MSALPEPDFIERDPQAVTDGMIARFEEITGRKLQPAQIERLLIDLVAYQETLIRIGIQEAAKQNLVDYARFPMLDELGKLVGVTRLPAGTATTTIRFTLASIQSGDVIIPADTEVRTNDGLVTFRVSAAGLITAGQLSVDLPALATAPGAAANGYAPGAVDTPLGLLPNISAVENMIVTDGGVDAEDDARLRQRIRLASNAFSGAGPRKAYIARVLDAHQSVVDVTVDSPSPGAISVYPLLDSGIPDADERAAILATLSADEVRPLGDQVSVLAPTQVDYSITAEITVIEGYVAADVIAAVTEALTTLTANWSQTLGANVLPSRLIATADAVEGVETVTLTAPSAVTVIADNEFSNATAITVTEAAP